MDQVYPVLGTPGVGFFSLLIIGAIAGWIAEKVTRSNHGLLTNIIVGFAGSFVGTRLAEIAEIPIQGFVSRLITAAVGAIILLFIWQALRGRSAPSQLPPGRTPIDKI